MAKQAHRAVLGAMAEFPDEHFYCVALHTWYREEDGVIRLPPLATHTVEELAENDSIKWAPPDWYWPELDYQNAALEKLERQLEEEATRSETEHWREVEARFISAMVNVTKALTKALRPHPQTTKDFVVLFIDDDDTNFIPLLQRCTTKAQFNKLFPDLAAKHAKERAIAAAPVDEQLQEFMADLWRNKKKLQALGEATVGPLVQALEDNEQRWIAADILGHIGVRDPKAIEALRRHARDTHEDRFHEAAALALLGDLEWLIELAKDPRYRAVAVRGICALYDASANDSNQRVPLDYGPLQRILEIPGCRKHVESTMGREVTPDDLDELLRGVESKYPEIRRHAVRHLGNASNLRRGAAARAVPAIAARLRDRVADIRWRAIVAIHYWKKAALPYLPVITELQRDKNERVRDLAEHYAKKLKALKKS